MSDLTDPKTTVMPLLIRRIYYLLPHRSHLSAQDTEKDEQFVYLRYFLLNSAGTGHFAEIVNEFSLFLQETLKTCESSAPEARPPEIRQSLLVVVRLLSELARAEWDLAQKNDLSPVHKPKNEKSIEHEYSNVYTDGFTKLFYKAAPPLDADVVSQCVHTLLQVRSAGKLKKCYSLLVKRAPHYHPPPDNVSEIDYHCEFVLFYLSASNWSQVFKHVGDAVIRAKTNSDDIIKNIDILGLLYLDEQKLLLIVDSLANWTAHVNKPIHRELIYFFAQECIMYWIRAHGVDMVTILKSDTPISVRCKVAFDQLFKEYPTDRRPIAVTSYMSTIMTLSHGGYKPTSSRKNKRDSFLAELEKGLKSNNIHDLYVSLRCLIFISKSATYTYTFAPDSDLVFYAQSLYEPLKQALLVTTTHFNITGYNIDGLIVEFITKYCFLRNWETDADFLVNIKSPSFPIILKLDIIKGILGIGNLPFGKSLFGSILSKFSEDIMSLSSDVTQTVFAYEDKTTDITGINYPANVDVLINCLILLQSGRNEAEAAELLQRIAPRIIPLVVQCINSTNKILRTTASNILEDVVRDVHHPIYLAPELASLTPNNVISHIFEGLGASLNTVSVRILRQGHDWRILEEELHLVKQYIEIRLHLIQHYDLKELSRGDLSLLEPLANRSSLSNNLEAALVYAITSSQVEVCKLALRNLFCMVQEALLLEDFDKADLSNWSIVANFATYSELSSSINLYSPVAIQKQMTKLFQHIETPSEALVNVWTKLYHEWCETTNEILYGKQLVPDVQKKWKTFSSVLSSLVGSLLNQDGYRTIPSDVRNKAKEFLSELVLILKSKNSFLHETSRDVLSTEPAPAVYTTALFQLNGLIHEEFQNPENVDVRWVTQIAVLLKAILSRMRNDNMYLPVEMADLTVNIVSFVDSQSDSPQTLRLACQVCYLLEVVGGAKDIMNLKHEATVKNKFVRSLADWLVKCSQSMFSISTSSSKHDHEMERLYLEKSLAVTKAMTLLLDGLPIVLAETTHEKEENYARSALFNNLFSLLLKVLGRLQEKEAEMKASGIKIPKSTGLDKVPLIQNELILCLSNLLSSNAELGLNFAMPLGYHRDDSLRLAFLQIFRNILSQGTKLSDAYNVKNKYVAMVNFLVKNMAVTLNLGDFCPAHDVEEFSTALCSIFDYKQQLLQLVKEAVKREIMNTDFPSDLLRRNCVATKMLLIFARSRGQVYLQRALGDFLKKMVDNPDYYVFENEASHLNDYSAYRDHKSRFDRCLEEVVQSLTAAEHLIPSSIRDICTTIAEAAEERFPGSKNSAVNSFFFLRFVCPVLVSPEREGLLDQSASAPIRRPLLLIAKTIQNIANGVGDTHVRSTTGVPAVSSSLAQKIIQLLTNLSSPGLKIKRTISNDATSSHGDGSSIVSSSSGRNLNIHHATIIHQFINDHWEADNKKMLMDIKKQRLRVEAGLDAAESGTKHRDELKATSKYERAELHASMDVIKNFATLVTDLGSVPVINEVAQAQVADTTVREFLERNRHRDTGAIIDRHIIDQGMTRDGIPMILMTRKNYDSLTCDTELIIYRLYQILQKVKDTEYIIVFDCTCQTAKNTIPPAANAILDSVMSDELGTLCQGVYYINMATNNWGAMKLALQHKVTTSFLNPMRISYHFLTSFDIVGDSIFNTKSTNFDPVTENLPVDPKAVFSNVDFIMSYKNKQIGVDLKLGNEYLQVLSKDSIRFVTACYGHYNDVYELAKIKDAYVGGRKERSGLFYIELEEQEKPLAFIAQNRQEIVRAILSARKRILKDMKQNERQTSVHETVPAAGRIEDKLPELLNMGLINLCSSHSALQQAAYELLVMIQVRFNVDFDRTMRGGPRLGIPKKEITMALSLSESAAKNSPEITYDFLLGLFSISRYFTSTETSNAISYAAPWFKNVYKYVFQADLENGTHRTARLVRHLLNLTCSQPEQYSALALNIWPSLCLEDGLSDLLVEEVVNFVTESALQDEALDSMLAVITAFPTLSMAGTVLKMIRNLLEVAPTDNGFGVEHPNWNVIEILTKICCSLTFDSLDMIEMYLPQFFFLITSFLYTGPLQFRLSLHSMLINLLHAFVSSPSLADDRRMHAMGLWQEACSLKGKLTFGLSEEAKPIEYDQFTMTGVGHVEYCSLLLLDVLDTVGSVSEANTWRARWSSLAIKYCFVDNISLQCRSLVVLGCLAKVEVDDEAIRRVIGIYAASFLNDRVDAASSAASRACSLSCLARMVEGVQETSVYPARLFWISILSMKTVEMVSFGQALQLLQASLKVLDIQGAFKNTSMAELLLESRRLFEPELYAVPKALYAELTPESFYSGILAAIMKGLEPTTLREATAKTLETLLEISARNSVRDRSEDQGKYPGYICYLYVLYLIGRTENEMKDLLWIAGYPDASISASLNSDDMPSLLKAYLSEDSEDSTMVMYLGGQLFRVCSDSEKISIRFLKGLLHVAKTNKDKKMMIYSMVRDKVVQIVKVGSSPETTRLAMEAALDTVMNDDEFEQIARTRQKLLELIDKRGFTGTLIPVLTSAVSVNTRFLPRVDEITELTYERRKLYNALHISMALK